MLKTRTLAYKAEAASDCPTDVIMPLVDFANHHPLAPPYMNFVDQSRNAMLVLKEFCPDPATRECYVRYGIYDAYDTFLYYGYVERRAPFVCSIPMELKLPGGGMITVHAFGSRTVRKDLPKPIADLAFFMPNFTADAEQRTAEVSHLIIPQGNAPRALRRVLAVIVHAVDPHLNVDEITAVVATIEPRILARNVEFYEKLRARLQQVDAPPEPAAIVAATRDVTDVQLAKLRQYPFFIASGGGGAGHTPAEAPG